MGWLIAALMFFACAFIDIHRGKEIVAELDIVEALLSLIIYELRKVAAKYD